MSNHKIITLNFKEVQSVDLLKYKIVLVLLLVVVLNLAVFVLLWQLNKFIHGDLYNYGLISSYEWIDVVWHNNLSCWAFIIGATAFSSFAMVPHYLIGKEIEPSRFSVLTGFLLPTLALVYEGLSIFFLNQIDAIVRNSLYDFGIPLSFNWGLTYEPIIWTAYVLMIISFVALIIPIIRGLGIIDVDTVNEPS